MKHRLCSFIACGLLVVTGLWLSVHEATAAGTFTLLKPMAAARWSHTATLLPNGKVLITGGSSILLATAELYDPASRTFKLTAPMATTREYHTATLLHDGKVLVAGGSSTVLTTEIYDPAKGTWSSGPELKTARLAHTATLLVDGRVLIAGGSAKLQWEFPTTLAEIYDPATGQITAVPPMASRRWGHTATLLPDGRVLVAGGTESPAYPSIPTPSPEIFDPVANTWTVTGAMKISRYRHTATYLPLLRKVLISGGYSVFGTLPDIHREELYDPATGTWAYRDDVTSEQRADHTATLLGDGSVLLAGGSTRYQAEGLNADLFHPLSPARDATGKLQKKRLTHTATRLQNGDILITGGSTVRDPLVKGSAELYSAFHPAFIFTGLVRPITPGTVSNLASEGFFTATMTPARTFTAKLSLDGQSLAFSGAFGPDGIARFGKAATSSVTVERLNKPSITIELSIDAPDFDLPFSLTGSITQQYRSAVTAVSSIHAQRTPYNASRPGLSTVPDIYLRARRTDGVLNMIFDPKGLADQPPGFTLADYPQGTGFGAARITQTGIITLAGVLADGTAFTAATTAGWRIRPHDVLLDFPLFAQLYNKLGFISTTLSVGPSENDMRWSRPYLGTQHYPFGWPEVIHTQTESAKPFHSYPGASIFQTPTASTAMDLSLSDGLLTTPFIRTFHLNGADHVTKIPATDKSFNLAVTRASGQFSGTFTHTDGTRPAFRGIVFQPGPGADDGARGHGFFLTTLPKVKTYTGQGGGVGIGRNGGPIVDH